MMGMRLLEMESCDALDVMHVLLEEDSIIHSKEEFESKQSIRGVIYGSMYEMQNTETRRTGKTNQTRADGTVSPAVATTKPYMPPTDPSQLTAVLGPPMG